MLVTYNRTVTYILIEQSAITGKIFRLILFNHLQQCTIQSAIYYLKCFQHACMYSYCVLSYSYRGACAKNYNQAEIKCNTIQDIMSFIIIVAAGSFWV